MQGLRRVRHRKLKLRGFTGLICAAAFVGLLYTMFVAPISPPQSTLQGVEAAHRTAGPRLYLTPAETAEASKISPELARVKSILRVAGPMKYGQFVWDEEGASPGPIWVRVDLKKQLISVFRGEDEIGSAVILYGADSHRTPGGTFPILAKSERHISRSYDAPMPYSLWLTRDGVAIHASEVRRGAATHGCIGIPPAFAIKLYALAKPGDKVVVVGADNAPLSSDRALSSAHPRLDV